MAVTTTVHEDETSPRVPTQSTRKEPHAELTLNGHEDWVDNIALIPDTVWTVAASPNGCWFVSGVKNGRVLVWGVTTNKRVPVSFQGHQDSVWSIVFTSDN